MTPESFQAPSLEELAPLFPAYSIDAFIAQGGMGAVYLATQTSLERKVAIKILPREFGKDASFRQSFAAEAKAMAKVNHPNLIGVYDFGEVDGMPFIVMEYVAGKPLHNSAYGKQIEPMEAARLVKGTLLGLQDAHDHDILHRDVKPANILLAPPHAEPKLGDFGLAMGASDDEGDGLIYGTPGYAAPEVYEGNPDTRSDIYAAAVVLYELLTGQLPANPYQNPSELAQCDRRFDTLLNKALQIDPAQRHQTARELADELEKIIQKPSAGLAPATRAPSPALGNSATTLVSQKSNSGPLIAGLVALIAVAAGVYFFLSQGSNKPAPAPSDPEIAENVAPNPVAPEPPEKDPARRPDPADTPTPEDRNTEDEEMELADLDDPTDDDTEDSKRSKRKAKQKAREDLLRNTPDEPEAAPQMKEETPVAVSTFDHHEFLTRGRDYFQKNSQLLLKTYDADLIKNIEKLEREGKSILRKEEYLERDTERARRDNLELAIKKFAEVGRFPPTLKDEIPEALDALTWKEGVVERAVLEALEAQMAIDEELASDLEPMSLKYIAGVRSQAEALAKDGQERDAQILESEIEEVESNPTYFLAIVRGEYPVPPGLEVDPGQLSLKLRAVGHWKQRNKNRELVLLSNQTAWKAPNLKGAWRIEDEEIVIAWEDGEDVLTFEDENPDCTITNKKTSISIVYSRRDRPTPTPCDEIVGSWFRTGGNAVYHFGEDGRFQVMKWKNDGTFEETAKGCRMTYNNGKDMDLERGDEPYTLVGYADNDPSGTRFVLERIQ